MWWLALRFHLQRDMGAAAIETALVLPLLIAILLATLALGLGAIAKAVVTNAARDSGRLAAIECGEGLAQWYQDAEAAAASALSHGLSVQRLTIQPQSYGDWSFQATCSAPGQPGGLTTVLISYDEVNLFPPLGAVLGSGGGAASRVFRLQAAAEYPEE